MTRCAACNNCLPKGKRKRVRVTLTAEDFVKCFGADPNGDTLCDGACKHRQHLFSSYAIAFRKRPHPITGESCLLNDDNRTLSEVRADLAAAAKTAVETAAGSPLPSVEAATAALAQLGPAPPLWMQPGAPTGDDLAAVKAALSPGVDSLIIGRQDGHRYLGPAGDLVRLLFGSNVASSNALRNVGSAGARLKWDVFNRAPAAETAAYSATVAQL